MGSFSLMHWIVVLAIILVLFSVGRARRASLPQSARFAIVMFLAGAVASAIAVVISLSLNNRDLTQILNFLTRNLDAYLILFASSGLTWIIFGSVIRSVRAAIRIRFMGGAHCPGHNFCLSGCRADIAGASRPLTWRRNTKLGLRIALLVRISGDAPIQHHGADPKRHLVAIASGVGGFGLRGDSVRSKDWSPGTMPGSGPGQATRLLCGNALLGGSGFRRRVLNFFENKRTAVAPEYGLDVWLLVNVCASVEARVRAYAFGFAGLGIVAFLVAVGSPTLGISLLVLASGALWFIRWRGEQKLARSFCREMFSPEQAAGQFVAGLDHEITDALPRDRQNVIVYKGFIPFVGAGLDLNGWSFVTSVDKPKVPGELIKQFTADELDAALNSGLSRLEIPDLECRKIYFVRGIDIREVAEILGDLGNRPLQEIGPLIQVRYDARPDERVRSRKFIQISDWGGELIVTFFYAARCEGRAYLSK